MDSFKCLGTQIAETATVLSVTATWPSWVDFCSLESYKNRRICTEVRL